MADSLAATASVADGRWGIRFRAALIGTVGTLGALVAGIAAVAYPVTFEASSRIHVTVQPERRSLP